MARSKWLMAALLGALAAAPLGCSSKKDDAKADKDKDDDDDKGGSKSSSEESATITKRYPAVGDKTTKTKERKMNLEGEITSRGKQQKLKVEETESKEMTQECLAVADKKCTKYKVTYAKFEKKETMDGKERVKGKPEDVLGKTFIVELKGDDVEVTLDGGGKPEITAELALEKEFKNRKNDHKVLDALPEKVKVGDSLDGVATALLESVAEEDADKAAKKTGTVKVKSIREEGGKKIITLAVSFTIEGEERKMKMKLEIAGTVDLRADTGDDVAMDLSGPLSMNMGEEGKLEGDMKEKSTSKHSF